MQGENSLSLDHKISQTKERLRAYNNWFPVPGLIASGLIILLLSQSTFSLNPRLGKFANPIELNVEPMRDGALHLSVSTLGEDILIQSRTKTFLIPMANLDLQPLEDFKVFLEEENRRIVKDATLSMFNEPLRTTVVFSVDQNLNYYHILPFIRSLAEAKITSFGFETKIVKKL